MTVTDVSGYLGQKTTRRWETLSRFTGGLLHSLTFGKRRPIEIQRALKLKSFQNRAKMPAPLARILTSAMCAGLGGEDRAEPPSCLLIVGERRCAS